MRQSARVVALWAVALYVVAQAVVGVVMDRWRPGQGESIRAFKEPQLRALAASQPDRPLVVMLGSSRTDGAFQAGRLNGLPGPGGRPLLAYNLGVPSAGPLREWMYLRALLAKDVRPSLLLVEVLPLLLTEPRRHLICEEIWTSAPFLSAPELVHLWPYFSHPGRKAQEWFVARLAPAYVFRPHFQDWLKERRRKKPRPNLNSLQDEWGCRFPEVLSVPERWSRLGSTHGMYSPTLNDFVLGQQPCQALRDLVACCRRENIPVALVLMPESSLFRRWYSPQAQLAVRELLAELSATNSAHVIDANLWLPDEAFQDGHHVTATGAEAFTTRLSVEVQRLLAQRQSCLSCFLLPRPQVDPP